MKSFNLLCVACSFLLISSHCYGADDDLLSGKGKSSALASTLSVEEWDFETCMTSSVGMALEDEQKIKEFQLIVYVAYTQRNWQGVVDAVSFLLENHPDNASFLDCRRAEFAMNRLSKKRKRAGFSKEAGKMLVASYEFYSAAAKRKPGGGYVLMPVTSGEYKNFLN